MCVQALLDCIFAFLSTGFIHNPFHWPSLHVKHTSQTECISGSATYSMSWRHQKPWIKTFLSNKRTEFADETWRAAVKMWLQFWWYSCFHFNRRTTSSSAARETTTTFGLRKPFEIPLDKLKNMPGGHAENMTAFLYSWKAIPSSLKSDKGHICWAKESFVCLMVTVNIYLETYVARTEQ